MNEKVLLPPFSESDALNKVQPKNFWYRYQLRVKNKFIGIMSLLLNIFRPNDCYQTPYVN